jgi:hypothetical protein
MAWEAPWLAGWVMREEYLFNIGSRVLSDAQSYHFAS